MPKEFKLQILWSTRNTPSEIRKMTSEDRINELITSGRWRCKIGSFNIWNLKEPEIELTFVKPTDPHGYIADIYLDDEEEKWYGDVTVPSTKTDWIEMVESMKEPVLHPLIIGGTTQNMIVMFTIIEQANLSDNIYDGIHYYPMKEEMVSTYRVVVTSDTSPNKDCYIARAKSEAKVFDMVFDYITENNTDKMYNNLGDKDSFKEVSTMPGVYESNGIKVIISNITEETKI